MKLYEYPARKRRYEKAAADLRAACYTYREHPGSARAHQALKQCQAEFDAAADALREMEDVFARMDAARTGERIEA